MSAIATLVVTLLTQLLPLVGSFTSGSLASVISLLEEILPTVVTTATELVAPVQNIITALQGSGTVTEAQAAALTALNAQCDAAFDAIAESDGV